jgi:hypothetical protein
MTANRTFCVTFSTFSRAQYRVRLPARLVLGDTARRRDETVGWLYALMETQVDMLKGRCLFQGSMKDSRIEGDCSLHPELSTIRRTWLWAQSQEAGEALFRWPQNSSIRSDPPMS